MSSSSPMHMPCWLACESIEARSLPISSSIVWKQTSEDSAKADRSDEVLAQGGVISVQVLNEFVSISTRKFHTPWSAIEETLSIVRALCAWSP